MTEAPAVEATRGPFVRTEGLRFREVLTGVDLEVGPGVTVLLGPDGAGKTSLLRILLGAERGTGSVTVLGRPVPAHALGVRAHVGYVPEDPRFYPSMDGRALGSFLAGLYPTWEAKRFFDLLARLGVPARRRIERLAPALRSRLALAAALAIEPELLVVDMPSQLGALGRDELLLGLEEERGEVPTLIATSHPAEAMRVADQLVLLARGAVRWTGSPSDLAADLHRLDVAGEVPPLPTGVEEISRRLGKTSRLWVHAKGEALRALEELSGVTVHPLDFDEAYLARVRA